MDFKEVRYFLQVARAGSFNRAAHELNIAQPALSRQVRKLETSLGVDLFVRHGGGVRLTSAGSLLYEGAESIHHMVKRTTERIRAGGENVAGHVTFGVPPGAGLLIAPRKRGIDPPFPATTKSVRLRDIVDLPLIMPGAPHSNRRLLDQAAVQHGVSLRVTLEADSVVLTKAMVKRGLGYTVLTMAAVQDDVARGELYAYPIMRPPLTNSLSIVVLRETKSSRFVGPLTRQLEKIMRDLVMEGTWQGAVIRR